MKRVPTALRNLRTLVRATPAAALAVTPAALVVAGFAATVAGIYLLAGLAVALIVGGVASATFGLLADF